MEKEPQLLVYKASAGSGKTFTLAVQYIRQLIEDPTAYRRILAVTFTNKATTEMKARILSQLYGIATEDKDSEGYLNEIRKATGKPVDEIRATAKKALHNLIHDYSRFRIETIDSFFQSVMRNLARELELNANLEIELNNVNVLSDAVDAMIEKLNRESPVLIWLLEYIEERIADDKRWNVANEIKKFGLNVFDEGYIEKGGRLRKKLADPSFVPRYRKEVKEMQTEAEEQMKGFSEHFIEVLDLNGLQPTDLKNGSRGIASYFNKLKNGKYGDEVRNATVEKCLAGADNWTTKTSKSKQLIMELAESQLMPLLEEAECLRPVNNMVVNSCRLSLRHLNNLRLLTHIDEEVLEQNRMHNRFLLADTNALLHRLIHEGDASFIYEKIGTSIDVVMIDEFQDTSRMQWENFHLLLEESMAQKEGSLIVGDIKQSIYRWRNGDWKILAGLDKDPAFHIDARTLDTNWRSEANVIAFNNDIFTAACKVLNEHHEEELGEPCPQLVDAYSDVCQRSPKEVASGYVKVSFLKDSKEHPYAEAMLEELAKEVDALVSSGVRVNDIAILVRKNKTIPNVAEYFQQHTPYRIVSDEAFRLDASLAVCMLIDGLRFLAQPEDRIACARLAVAFQREVLQKDIDLNTVLLNNVEDYLPAGFMLQVNDLRLMPLYELLEKLFVLFDLKKLDEQDAYLCAFYDAVTDYLQKNSSELTTFLHQWDETLHGKTIPSGEISGIRILSIHKSKGLEYHTVLIPYCDWSLENETNDHLIWCASSEAQKDLAPFNELDLVPVNYSKAMAESIYKDSFLEERLQLWVDNLNLLYVAFTRAGKNLIVWCKDGKSNSVSELLQDSIGRLENIQLKKVEKGDGECDDDYSGAGGNAESKAIVEAKACDIADLKASANNDASAGAKTEETSAVTAAYEFGTRCPSVEKAAKASTNRLLTEPTAIPVHIESIDNEIEFKQSNRSADFIRGDEEEDKQEQYIQQGQLMHHLFASIGTAEDIPSAIEQLSFEGVLESAEQEEKLRKLAAWALGNPKVKDWYSGRWELFNECAIIYPDEEGKLQTRRPDRVMMDKKEVVVVDFKFGRPRPEYVEQVREYIHLLEEMGYQHISGYLWYVYTNKIEEVDVVNEVDA